MQARSIMDLMCPRAPGVPLLGDASPDSSPSLDAIGRAPQNARTRRSLPDGEEGLGSVVALREECARLVGVRQGGRVGIIVFGHAPRARRGSLPVMMKSDAIARASAFCAVGAML